MAVTPDELVAPPQEVPGVYTDAVAKLHKTARNLMVLFIQATLSDGAGGVGLRPQQPPLHGCDLPADRGPHVPGGSRGSTIHGSWGACNTHGLVRTGTAGEGLGGEDQAHQTQAGPLKEATSW